MTSGGQAAVARATAAVFVDGRRTGAAAVAGPATGGPVQLDWIGDAGTFPGHSGGPVIEADGHALAGILVEGSERGRFDRFVPIMLIAQVWPGLPRPWLITGAEPGEARS